MSKSSKDMELIIKNNKKNNKKNKWINEDQSGSDSDINEICESEEEFDNINEIEDSDDSGNENYHNTYHKKKICVLLQILKAKMKQKMLIIKKILWKQDPVDSSFMCLKIVFEFGSHQCLDYYIKRSKL